MGALLRECPQRGDLAGEVSGEEEYQLDELDCLRSLEQVIPQAQVQQW